MMKIDGLEIEEESSSTSSLAKEHDEDDEFKSLYPSFSSSKSKNLPTSDTEGLSCCSFPLRCIASLIASVQFFYIYRRTEFILALISIIIITLALTGIIEEVNHLHSKHSLGSGVSFSIASDFDLSIGQVDHWCLQGNDDKCDECSDPTLPNDRADVDGWIYAHKKNVKMIEAFLESRGMRRNMQLLREPAKHRRIEATNDDDIGEGKYDDDFFDVMTGNSYYSGGDDNDILDWDPQKDHDFGLPQSDGNGDKHPDVVFIGDGIVENFTGRHMGIEDDTLSKTKRRFEKNFLPNKGGEFDGLALGVEGDTSTNLLWRLMHGELPNDLNPRVWWLNIGMNDLVITKCSEDITLLGILRVVSYLRDARPNAKIVINSILPYSKEKKYLLTGKKRRKFDFWSSISSINSSLAKYAENHAHVRFFDASPVFVINEGGKKSKTFIDNTYIGKNNLPSIKGYKYLIQAIVDDLQSIITKMNRVQNSTGYDYENQAYAENEYMNDPMDDIFDDGYDYNYYDDDKDNFLP